MHQAGTRCEYQCVQPTGDQPQRLKSTLSVNLTEIFDHKRVVPLDVLNDFERYAALGDVPFILLGDRN